MATTNFIDKSTIIEADWLNDVDNLVYTEAPVLRTVVAASGNAVSFTGIDSWARQITVMLDNISSNGINTKLVQIGDSDGYETSGYDTSSASIEDTTNAVTRFTTGFNIRSVVAAHSISGQILLTLMDSTNNVWTAQGIFHSEDSDYQIITSGIKTLSGTLDRIRLILFGADNFDAGNVNIRYTI